MTSIIAAELAADDVASGQCSDERLAEHLGGWLWRTDAEHRFIWMSPSVARFAGKPPEWHYRKTRQELGNINVADAGASLWLGQMARGDRFGPVDFVRYQDGQLVWMRTIGVPVLDARGAFKGHRGIAVEVPEATRVVSEPPPRPVRWRVVRPAEIEVGRGPNERIPCTIVNLSVRGAGLSMPADVRLPATFRLFGNKGKPALACELRWQEGTSAGVRFIRSLSNNAAPHQGSVLTFNYSGKTPTHEAADLYK